jgi:hypothetical protein
MDTTARDRWDPCNFDQGEFRYLAAKAVKLLIRARWKSEPGFLSDQDLARWGLADVGGDRATALGLLDQAADALDELSRRFLPGCSSGGVPARWDNESTPAGRVQARLFGLTFHHYHGSDVSQSLREAAARLREGEAVDWVSLVDWRLLPAMREDLDLLPHPKGDDGPERLERIESLLTSLVEREQVKDFYSTEEFAGLVNKAEFTVREWCRLGRIKAAKKGSGRGKHQAWVVGHDELLRYRKEGLLAQPR